MESYLSRKTRRPSRRQSSLGSVEQLENRVLLAADAFEPNESRGTATDLGSSDQLLEDLTIEPTGDDDWFKFTAGRNGGLRVQILFEHALGDLDMEIFDSGGIRLVNADSATDNEEALVEVNTNGEYFIHVEGFNDATNTYDLVLDGPQLPMNPDKHEDDDTFEQAKDVGSGDITITDLNIDTFFDSDYTKWTASANGSLVVDITFEHDQGNLDLDVFDSNRNLLGTSDSTTDNERVILQGINQGEMYFFRVSGLTNPNYTLGINGPLVLPDTTEPNETMQQATELPLGDQTLFDLTISSTTDQDWFKWTSSAKGELTVTTKFAHVLGNVDLKVFDVAGNELGSSTSITDDEQVVLEVDTSDMIFIQVFGPNGQLQQGYDLVIDGPELAADSSEPNDTFATASDLGSGDQKLLSRSIHAPNNRDFYKWVPSDSGQVKMDVLFDDGFGNIDIRLLNAAQNVIASSSSLTDNETLEASVQAGQKYVLEVFGPNGSLHPDYDVFIDGPEPAPDRFEVNDSASQAADLGTGDQLQKGLSLHEPFGDDWFKWTADETGELEVQIFYRRAVGDLDLDLFTVDTDGNISHVDSSQSVSDFELVTGNVVAGQMMLIHVYGFGNVTNPNYELLIDGPSSLSDPGNDSIATATDIGRGDNIFVEDLSLNSDTDEDFLKWTADVTAGTVVDVSFVHVLGNVDVQVQDMDGNVLAESTSLTDNEQVVFPATADQMYFLRIFSPTDDIQLEYDVSVTVNDPPTIGPIADQTSPEDETIGPIIVSVSDPDSDPANWTLSADSNNSTLIGNITINEIVATDGGDVDYSVTIEPVANQSGTATVTLAVEDGDEGMATQSFQVEVTPVNDAPVVVNPIDDIVVDEDAADISIDLTQVFSDVDIAPSGDSLTITVGANDNPGLVSATIDGNNLVIGFSENASGEASISVIATDTQGESAAEKFLVTVNAVNDAPVISPIADVGTSEDVAPPPIPFTVSDVESTPENLTIVASVADPTLASVEIQDAAGDGEASFVLLITPATEASGITTVSIDATDEDGATSTETFQLSIAIQNDLPTISAVADQTTDEDTPTGAILFDVDDAETPSGDLAVSVSSSNTVLLPNEGVGLELVGGDGPTTYSLVLTPVIDQSGSSTVTLTVADANGGTAEQSFQLNVTPVNDAPTVVAPIGSIDALEDDPNTILDLGTVFGDADLDTSGDELTFSVQSNSNESLVAASVDGNNLILDYQDDQNGSTDIVVRATDSGGQFVQDVATVNVAAVNDAPSISPIADIAAETGSPIDPVPFTVTDVDSDATLANVTVESDNPSLLPSGNIAIQEAANDGEQSLVLIISPVADQIGTANVTVTASDDQGASSTESFAVNVILANDPPVFTSDANVTIPENTTPVTTVTAVDPDGDDLSYRISGGDDQALFAINNISGALVFFSAPDFEAPADADGNNVYQLLVAVSDGTVESTQVLSVNVTDVDEAAPTVTIQEVEPDPRAGGVSEITIQFSEPVSGLDKSDLALTRATNSVVNVSLDSATLTTNDSVTWTLGNLIGLTGPAGQHELSLIAGGSGIQDSAGNPLAAGTTQSWSNGAGDADENGQFDQLDVVAILQAGKYLTGASATWSEGDFNLDGVFNQFDIILAQQTQPPHYLTGPFAAQAEDDDDDDELSAVDAVFGELGS